MTKRTNGRAHRRDHPGPDIRHHRGQRDHHGRPGRAGHGPGSARWAGVRHRLSHALRPHGHEAADKVDQAMETSAEGVRTLWISLAVLGATTLVQAAIVAFTGSVALLGDTIHNGADAFTAVPLGAAFMLGRRPANRRYTYGYGRAEDLAGIAIVLTITASAAVAAYAAFDRLLHPRGLTGPWAVAAAAVVGPAITAAILLVVGDAATRIYRRLMDAVDPALVDAAEQALLDVDGVRGLGQVRMRWIGHRLRAETDIIVDPHLTVTEAHTLAVYAERALAAAVPRLTAAAVHIDHTVAARASDPAVGDVISRGRGAGGAARLTMY